MKQVVDQLRRTLPPEGLVTDPDRMESYRFDRAMFCPAGEPLAVVLARETAHAQAAVRIPAAARAVERIATDLDITVGVLGHAGDGNMHPTVVFDAADAEQSRRAEAAFDRIMEVGLELGGTITGEQGVGMLKRDWLRQEIGPVGSAVHRAIKAALDPENIPNPSKVVALGDL
jgi:FAD/FMN-containing dehydrogenase